MHAEHTVGRSAEGFLHAPDKQISGGFNGLHFFRLSPNGCAIRIPLNSCNMGGLVRCEIVSNQVCYYRRHSYKCLQLS